VTATLYERATALIEKLFQSPSAPEAWRSFLGALCSEVSTDAVAILVGQIVREQAPLMLAHGLDLKGVSTERILPIGEQTSEQEAPVGGVITIAPASEIFARTGLFQNVLEPAGLPPGPGFSVVLGRDPQQLTGALLVLSRDPTWQPSADDRALLELLAPYVRRAVRAGLRLLEEGSDVRRLLGLFDTLTLGVVLLDDRSRVSFVNRSAAEILGSTLGPAGLDDEAPEAKRDRRTAALRVLLRSQAIGSPGASLSHPHPDDGRALQIVSTPLHWPGAQPEIASRFTTALFLGDPGVALHPPVGGLAALYGLTPAEERLATLLGAGSSLSEAAAQLSIRLSTARGMLKSVFAKTGTRRQASLVNRILTLPALVRGDSPRGKDSARPN